MVCSRAIHRTFQDAIMHVANVKHSHCEAKFCRVWAKFGRVRRRIALLRTDHQFGCDKAVEKGVLL